ncbi:hypothetical protein M231_04456 [Tremella mesenterica]|uniref:6-phosphogluconate dehydrogenase NADP-binding domain-containing protein n=1 Tax=Tremella mesenterica TaxID=5217 RepID=A0A4Q1BKH2_TREME|nr:hypothetical protein M231_04456 [Tremella mesenterica]
MVEQKIGYVGLGAMGSAIAPHVADYALKNNFPPLTLWNRSVDKYEPIKEKCPGAYFAKELKEVTERCNVVFSCLLNDEVSLEVYGELVKGIEEKVVFIDQSSLNPKTSVKLAEMVQQAGGVYLACPVFGLPIMAANRMLVCIMSGPKEEKEWVKPLVRSLGKELIDVGENVATGSQTKFAGNGFLLGILELLGELYAMLEAIGYPKAAFNELMEKFIGSPSVSHYSKVISEGNFDPTYGFLITTGLKDCRHILSLGSDANPPVKLPLLEMAADNMRQAAEIDPTLDWSAMSIILRRNAGLHLFSKASEEDK